ncbi:YadA-like family protein [Fusobacterium pseudoperiodonticum]|uniref:YadA-like family protein n=1 Tax=Fusobacterium pseudoperiodonticum TaxID=2663009 RepID=UPI0016505E7A|nr:YadA-like family protein [Fusobacterium pseudoperiodonticum]
MNNKERDEKFLKSWLKKKISITTSTVVSFLITGAIGGGTAYGVNNPGTGGNDAVAIGTGSNTTGDGVAIGKNSTTGGPSSSISLGVGATSKYGGIAIGEDATAQGKSIVIGSETRTPGYGTVVIGDGAGVGSASGKSANGDFSISIGRNAGKATDANTYLYNTITIGANTKVGETGKARVSQSIAIGGSHDRDAKPGAWAAGDQSIALGSNTIARGDSSVAIGGDDLDSVAGSNATYIKKTFDKNGNQTGTTTVTKNLNQLFGDLTGRGAILNANTTIDGVQYSRYKETEAGQGAVALGVKAISGDIALAIGTMSEARGINSVAIGTGAQTPQANAVAIGGGSTTNGIQGRQVTDADIALSDGTTMTFTNFAGAANVEEGSMVSFGRLGKERQLKNIAPGEVTATSTDGINGSQLFAVAKKLGDDISKFKYVSIKSNDAGNKLNDGATANNAIAIGPNASTKVESAVSLGDGANVLPGPTKDKAGTLLQTVISSGSGVAIGKNATATQAGVAIGDTSSTVTSGIAIGREAKVTNKYEAASGPYVVGDSQDGYMNYDRIQNPDNLQYSKTEATGNNIFSPDRYNGQGIAIGYKAESNLFGTSLGNSAVAKLGGLALGTFAKAEGATATAIGLGANSSGARGISMGRQASATTADSVAIGTGARGGATSAGGSVAIGGGAAATGTQAIAIGGLYGNDLYSSSATKDGAGNLTKNTQASGAGSIAMGVNAVANKDNALALGGSTQVFKNEDVALGYGSKVISAPTSVTSATVGGVTYGGFAGTNPNSSLSIGSAGNERQIKNVAAGEISATSTDAINGSQLYSVANKLSQGWTATADGNKIGTATPTAVKPGNTVVYSAGSNLQVKQTIDATNGKQTYEYSLNKDLTGLDSVTTKTITVPGATPGTNDVVIGKDGINAGSKPITNVAPGVNGTDAVNKNQLDQKIGDNTIKLGGDKGTTGTQNLSQGGGLQFNIKGGDGLETSASGTDVTVQLDTVTKQKLNKAVLPLKFSGDDYDPFDEVSTVVSKELGQKLEIVGGADTTDPTKLSNNNIGTMVNSTGKVNIKLAKELKDLTSAEFKTPAGDKTVINGDGLTVTPVAPGAAPISVTKDGINAGNKTITNVAPGVNGTDAVNKNQLDQKIGDNKIKLGGDTGTTATQDLSKAGGLQFNVVGTTAEIVTVASGDQVKVGLAQAVKDNIDNKANKDLSNLTPAGIDKIKDTAAWKVKANNNTAETVKGGDEVVFKDGAGVTITQSGKEFTISADTSKISKDTKISYTANGDAPKKEVSLADGFNFENGNLTTASVDTAGKVKYDVKTSALTSTPDGKVTVPTTDGVATAKDVANAINNSGWKANADATGTGIKTGTPSAQLVKNGSTVSYVAGNNLTVAQDVDANGNHKYTYSLNKDLKDLDSVTTKTITIPGATPGTNDVVIGKDGISAGNKVIKDVAPGVNGTDAVNKNQLDTATNDLINKGMNFSADDYDPATANTTISKKLGERLEIIGGADKTKLSDNNIGSVVDNTGKINVKLAKELTGLTSAEFKTPAGDKTVINGDGLTVTPVAPGAAPISVTKDGINAGNKTITNVAPGVNGTDAVNKNQLDQKIGDNKIKLGGDTGTTATQDLSKAGGLQFNVVGTTDEIVTVASGDQVKVGLAQAVKDNIDNKANKDLSNLTPAGIDKIKDTAAWKVKANNNAAETVKGGDEVVFKDGAGVTITQSGKEFTISADTSKISKDTKISYTANGDAPKKEVSLADGFNFENGTLTTASVDTAGKVKYDVKTSALTSTPDGKVTVPTTDGVATAKDVANAINNSGWKANADATGTGIKTGTPSAQLVKNGSTVSYVAGNNLTVAQDVDANGNHKYTYSLNKDLKDLDSVTSKTITVPGATPGTNDVVIGKDGISAGNKVIKDVAPGVNGTDAVNKNQLDTTANDLINKGMNFSADDYDPATANTTVSKKLGERLEIIGGADKTKLSDNNIGSVVDNTGKINVKLAKELTGLTSAEFKTPAGDKTVINGDGLTVTPGAPGAAPISVTKDGINAGNKTITNVAPGVNGTDAVNKNQLDQKIGDNKIKLGGDTGTTATQDLSKAGGLQFNVVGTTDEIVTVASGDQVKVGLAQAVKDNIDNKANKDLSNLTPAGIDKIKDTAAWKVKANNNAAETVKGGDEVVFKDGAGVKITQSGKEFTISADTSKISQGTKLSYTANGDAPKQEVTLADGLNFKNGNFTTATVGANGEVKYDTVTQSLNVSPDGKAGLPNPATPGATTPNGLVTAQDVANALNNVGWNATADATGTGIKTGTPSAQLVKNGSTVSYVAGNNLTVAQDVDANGNHKYTYSLNKDLKDLDSVTSKTITVPGATPGTNDVVIGKDGISAGNKVIKDVAPGVNGTDAVNKNQLDTTANDLINKGMNFSADDYDPATANTTVSKKLGERLEIVGGADKTKLSDNNIGSVVDNTGKINVKLAKELKDLTSAEFKTPAGDKTVINGDGLTVSPATPTTSPISVTKYGISAGDKKVTNVAPGTISKTSTDAINGSQLYNLASNTIQLGGDNATTTATQQLDKAGGIKFDIVGANGITTEAKDGKVTVKVDSSTIGTNSKLKYTANGDAPKQEVTLADGLNFKNGNFTTATVGANGEVKYDTVTQSLSVSPDGKAGLPNPATPGATTPNGLVTAQDVADALNSVGWKATADATGTGVKTGTPSAQLVKNGSTVTYVAGNNLTVAQDVTAGDHKYTYSLNKDLKDLDSVTTKTITIPGATPGTNDVVIGKDGISAGNKVIKDVAPGVNGTDAVNKNQLDTATNDLINKGMNFSADDYDPATANTTVSKKLGERLEIVGGADKTKLSDNNIGSVVDNTGKINVKLAKELKDLTSAEFKTPAGDKTVINGDGLTVSPATPTTSPISVTKDGISAGDKKVTNVAPGTISKTSTDAINGSQLYNLASNTIQLGGDNATTTATQQLDKAGGIKFDIVGANGITTEAKDGKVTVKVDAATIGANTKLKYKSNSDAATSQEVKLADGLDFKNGNFTTASVGANGEVKYDTVTQGLAVGPDGKASLPNPATPGATTPNGLVTAQDVADALNNVGWKATADATGTGIKTGTPSAQLVKNGSTVSYVAGDNLTVAQDVTAGDHKYTYSLNKVLKDLTSAEFKTPAGDKTVINGDGLTVNPATPGTAPISITKDGISAGDKVVKNVAPGTISSTSTDAINGSQFHKLATNTIQLGGDNATTTATQQLDKNGGIKFNIVGENGITTKATGDKVSIGVDTSTIGANIKLKYKSNSDAATTQEVKLSDGLDFKNGNFTTATVGANGEVKYDTVTQGLAVGPDGKAGLPNPATPGATTPNGLVTAQDVANALNSVGWNATADATGTGVKTGTPSAQLVKNGSTVSYVAGDNLTVAQDVTAGDHKYTYSLNKVLKDLTSAEFKTPAGDKTVINGDGLTVSPATPTTSPISVTKDGISAGDKKVTNVAPGTISKTSTDAINGSQLYNLASNTIQLGGDKATTTDKQTLDKAGGIKFDIVGANGITTEAKDGKVTVKVDAATIGANTKLKYKSNSDAATSQEVKLSDGLDFKNGNFTTASVGANGEVKYDTVTQGLTVTDGKASLPNPATPGATTPNGLVTAQDVADALNNVGWKATADATGTGIKTGTPSAQLVKNGSTVSYVAGDNLTVAQDVTAGDHKYTYSLNKQLKDLTSAEFVNPTSGNKTVVNGDGLTITPSTPGAKNISITKDGISAGDKKITDVADGDITPTSKDAINGSQLYKLASNTISLGGDNSTVTATQQLNKNGGIKFNIVGDNGIITEAKDDKVIVRVNPSTIGSNITLKYAANGANDQTVKLSDGLNFQDGNFTKASVDAQGKVKYDTVTQAIAPTADGKAQVAPGSTPGLATSADVVNAINNSGWKATAGGNVTGTATPTLVKNGQEVEFNAGDNLKVKQTIDPTTGKQTYEYSLNKDLTGLNSAEFTNAAGDKTKITAGNTEYTNAAGDKTVVNADGLTISSSTPGAKDISVTKDGISAGDKVIKNVAAGVNDTDAVNVSQLKDVDNKITNVNNTINKGLNFKGNTGATVNKQLGDTLEIVGEGTKADSEYSGQNLKVVEDNGKLVVKMDKNLKSDTVTADAVNTNSVTVGAPGKDGVITVKDANGKDGVSINGKDGSIGLNGKDGSSATISTVQGNPGVNGTPGTTMDRIQYTDNSGTPHQVATLDDGMKYGGDTGAVINKKLNQQVNVVGGITDVTKLAANDNIGVVSDGSNNLKVRLAKDLDGLETVTVRDASGNTTVVKGDGVTITSPSGNTVSLSNQGLDNGGNVITNVAAGKDGTDAVNVDQLNQTVGNVVNAAGDAIAHVNNKVDKLGDRVNKGLAGAAAMAGLEFMDIGINQATVAAAVGGYRGTHAVAVGVQAAPTENTRINAKVSMTPGSRSETMYSVGASYRFNWR